MSVFNHRLTIYLSPNFLKEMLKRKKVSKKVNFLSLTVFGIDIIGFKLDLTILEIY